MRTAEGARTLERLRLRADAASVPGARRFVAELVARHHAAHPGLVDDAELCVSELATNAATHTGSTYMEVAVEPLAGGVRISVEDDSEATVGTVAPRMDLSLQAEPDSSATGGRGLAIVSFLGRDWGVEHTPRGKRVWVDLASAPC